MDSRTGLGRFRQFRISNYELMMKLIDYCRDHSVDRSLRCRTSRSGLTCTSNTSRSFVEQILRCARVYEDLVVLDLRNEEVIYAGNRFMIYALFPTCRVSMHVLWGIKQQNTVFAIGKSISRPNLTSRYRCALSYLRRRRTRRSGNLSDR